MYVLHGESHFPSVLGESARLCGSFSHLKVTAQTDVPLFFFFLFYLIFLDVYYSA